MGARSSTAGTTPSSRLHCPSVRAQHAPVTSRVLAPRGGPSRYDHTHHLLVDRPPGSGSRPQPIKQNMPSAQGLKGRFPKPYVPVGSDVRAIGVP